VEADAALCVRERLTLGRNIPSVKDGYSGSEEKISFIFRVASEGRIRCPEPFYACHGFRISREGPIVMVNEGKPVSANQIEKAKGVLYGLAIGDAIGAPVEFLSANQIEEKYGERGIRELPEPARFTDDTQLSLAVAEALIRAGESGIDSIMDAVREKFVGWLCDPETPAKAPDATCMQAVSNMEKGFHWTQSGDRELKGSVSAARSGPIGYLYQFQPEKLKGVAHAVGFATHAHDIADVSAVGAAYVVKLALDGTAPDRMVPELITFTVGISDDWYRAVSRLEEYLTRSKWEEGAHMGDVWIGQECVSQALYCFLRHPDSYVETVFQAANTSGDSDTVACIAGGISGAYLGVDGIPEDWIKSIEKSAYLADLAYRLARKKESIGWEDR